MKNNTLLPYGAAFSIFSLLQNPHNFVFCLQPSDSFPSALLASNAQSLREAELAYSFPISQSMASKYNNSVSSIGGQTVSMAEVVFHTSIHFCTLDTDALLVVLCYHSMVTLRCHFSPWCLLYFDYKSDCLHNLRFSNMLAF